MFVPVAVGVGVLAGTCALGMQLPPTLAEPALQAMQEGVQSPLHTYSFMLVGARASQGLHRRTDDVQDMLYPTSHMLLLHATQLDSLTFM